MAEGKQTPIVINCSNICYLEGTIPSRKILLEIAFVVFLTSSLQTPAINFKMLSKEETYIKKKTKNKNKKELKRSLHYQLNVMSL